MNLDASTLTRDPKIIEVISALQHENHKQAEQIKELTETARNLSDLTEQLKEKLKLFQAWIFRRRSEKRKAALNDGQYRLFNEAEECVKEADGKDGIVTVAEHVRKKGGRKPISDNLPRVEIVHDIPESEKKLSDGTQLKKIRDEVHETIFTSPKVVVVLKHVRPVYVSPVGDMVRTASPEPQMIPKSIASAGLLADVLTSKFCDALPFYRQEKIFNRFGMVIPRQTMCQWAMKVYERAQALEDIMEEDIKAGPVIKMDETPVQVLNEKDRSNTTKSFMWVSSGGPPGKPVLLYRYHPTRNAGFIEDFLGEYKGILQSDGYAAYDTAAKKLKLVQAGCWAHARRGFMDVLKIEPKSENAKQAVDFVGRLYDVEKKVKTVGMTADQLKETRQKESVPILDEFKIWLDEKSIQVPPKSSLGEAVSYCLGQWDKLTTYTKAGNVPIDNNEVENAIRPFVIGKKNWLFSASPDGAKASAFLYSLIETAKANGFEPYWYLFYLFEKFPLSKGEEDYKKLLPYNMTQKNLDDHFDNHPILSRINLFP